jgi:hypothetical protein
MMGKTREQLWRELDALGEEEVRRRLAAQPEDVGDAGLIREWLDQKAPAAAEQGSTRAASERSAVSASVSEAFAPRSGLAPRTVGIMGIFLLGILYTLYFARAFLLPITIAILLNFLLSPAVRALKRLRLPEPVGAALVVLGLLGLLGVGSYEIAGPAQEWLAKGPASLRQAQSKHRPESAPASPVCTHSCTQRKRPPIGGPSSCSRIA